MILIKNGKNTNIYKCFSILFILLLIIPFSLCDKKINDFIIKNINYGKNKYNVSIDLQFDNSKKFSIKDYDIDNIRPNSKIHLIKNLTFHARALTPKIFQFLIIDSNSIRSMPCLIDSTFKINLIKEKAKEEGKSKNNLDNFRFELEGGVDQPFSFKLKDKKTKEYLYIFDGANFFIY